MSRFLYNDRITFVSTIMLLCKLFVIIYKNSVIMLPVMGG